LQKKEQRWEAAFWRGAENGRAKCFLCPRFCSVPEGKVGFCGVRGNFGGRLYALSYGRLTAAAMDPIEKKPLFHYMPGSRVLSISTAGCTFACQFCQNFEISQRRKVEEGFTSPEEVVQMAMELGADGITGTYNEPTTQIEYLIDVMKLARRKGLFTTWVSDGYMTPEAVDALAPCLDAITIDFKGNGNERFYRKYIYVPSPAPIFEAIKALIEKRVHVEVTNLVVPVPEGMELEDVRKMAEFLRDVQGEDATFHLLAFHPDYKMLATPATPRELLLKMYGIAKEVGIKYVYVGNMWEDKYETTYCPSCGIPLVVRHVFGVKSNILKGNQCPECGASVPIVTHDSRVRRGTHQA
jgi:pyruvate formate lyase activating enzyme